MTTLTELFSSNGGSLSHCVNKIAVEWSEAAIKLAAISQNFTIAYSDLPAEVKSLAAMYASVMNCACGSLQDSGYNGVIRALSFLTPAAETYAFSVLREVQTVIDTDQVVRAALTTAVETSHLAGKRPGEKKAA